MSPNGFCSTVTVDVVDMFTTAGREASATSAMALLKLLSKVVDSFEMVLAEAAAGRWVHAMTTRAVKTRTETMPPTVFRYEALLFPMFFILSSLDDVRFIMCSTRNRFSRRSSGGDGCRDEFGRMQFDDRQGRL